MLGLATGTWTHKTDHGPDLGVSHHLAPYSILCVTPRDWHPNVTFSRDSRNGIPKLSRSCPECVPVGLPGLWTAITPRPDLGSGRGLNQYCSPRQDFSNDVLHSPSARRERVDSRLLVVGSQTANLTPAPSFAHNLGCKCPNGQCEAIFDIYASRPFQWHQEHPNARCFGPCCRTLNIRESRRTPSPQLWECWASPPHLAKVGLRHQRWAKALPRRDTVSKVCKLEEPIIVIIMHTNTQGFWCIVSTNIKIPQTLKLEIAKQWIMTKLLYLVGICM